MEEIKNNEKDILYKSLSDRIICAAFNVYNILGSGFLEKVYENALCIEFDRLDISYKRQKPITVLFREQVVGDYIADIIVDQKIIIEIKATQDIANFHNAQILNYLKATNYRLGYLINFGNKGKLYFKRFIN